MLAPLMARTYKAQILSWDWNGIVLATKRDADTHQYNKLDQECVEGCDALGHVGFLYLGSVMSLAPSGKYWTFWTRNQTADDMRRDTSWFMALEQVASRYDGWIESGEGDPTDLYFKRYHAA